MYKLFFLLLVIVFINSSCIFLNSVEYKHTKTDQALEEYLIIGMRKEQSEGYFLPLGIYSVDQGNYRISVQTECALLMMELRGVRFLTETDTLYQSNIIHMHAPFEFSDNYFITDYVINSIDKKVKIIRMIAEIYYIEEDGTEGYRNIDLVLNRTWDFGLGVCCIFIMNLPVFLVE
jgi:hypothetical protein